MLGMTFFSSSPGQWTETYSPTFYDGINETSIHCDVISRRVFSEKHLEDEEMGGEFPTLFQLTSLSVVNGGASKIYTAMKVKILLSDFYSTT